MRTPANATDGDPFRTLRVVVASARNGAHHVHLIVGCCTIFVLYAVLDRFALVPGVLAGFGLDDGAGRRLPGHR